MQTDNGLMRAADLADDGQPQAGTGAFVAAPVEAREDLFALLRRNSWPIVFDFQQSGGQDPQNHIAACWGMGQGVIQQIAQQLVKQGRLAADPHRLLGLQRQGDAPGVGQGGQGHAQLAGQLAEIQTLGTTLGEGPRATFDARQGQQLVGQMGEFVGVLRRLLQGAAPDLRLPRAQAQFDPLSSFIPVTQTSSSPTVLLVPADSPIQTAKELEALVRSRPGQLNYGSGGIGTAAHLMGATFANQLKLDAIHVPYRGSVELMPALLGKQIQFAFPIAGTAVRRGQDTEVASLEQAVGDFERELLQRLYPSYPSTRQLAARLNTSHTAIAQRLRKYGIPAKP